MNTKQLIIKLYLLTVSCLILLSSCSSSDEPNPPAEVQRTILVYMVADNTLGGTFDRADISEMLDAADAGDLNGGRLLIYHVPYTGNPLLKEIKPNHQIDTLKVYDKSELSVSASRMSQVIKDVKQLAPAEDYGMILWSHSTGWLQNGIEETSSEVSKYSFGYDSKKTNAMNITTMAQVLQGQGMSFLYFDCCNMACVEVAYELRNVTKLFAGSVTELPAPGMPYDKTLKYLFQSGEADVEAAAAVTYNDYIDLYNTQISESGTADYPFFTITVVDTKQLDALADATKQIYQYGNLGLPSRDVQMFATKYYYDLRDYVEALADDYRLANDKVDEDFEAAMTKWNKALSDAVLYTAGLPQMGDIHIATNCGLSTYVLSSQADWLTENYYTLSWATDVVSTLLNKQD